MWPKKTPDTSVVGAADEYLDYYKHSPASYERVREVLDKYERMVSLARERALAELTLPTVVVYMEDYRKSQ